jgi:hypothetical protein
MALVSARPVREHVLKLRTAGGTYETIGRAAGTGAMTVHCIANGRRPKVQAGVARRLLAVNEDDIRSMHPSAGAPCGGSGHWSRWGTAARAWP